MFTITLPDGTNVFLWTNGQSWEEVFAGNGLFTYVVQFGTDDLLPGINQSRRFYSVLGIETPQANVPTSGTATYNGTFFGTFYLTNSTVGTFTTGSVALNADFGAATIGGLIDNVTDGGVATQTRFNVDQTNINGGEFNTTISVDQSSCAPNCATINSSNVAGKFYGPNAEEVGGFFSIDSTSTAGNNVITHGNFAGKQ